MNLIEMATHAGLQVLLDARIGNQTYQSVSGSLEALERFADAVRAAASAESVSRVAAKRSPKRSRKHPVHRRATPRTKPLRRPARFCGIKAARSVRPSHTTRSTTVC